MLLDFLAFFVAKLGNRYFGWFPSAMLVLIRMGTGMASPYIGHRCPKLTLRVWNVNLFFHKRVGVAHRRPLRHCIRNKILRFYEC